ncbi:MAG: acyl carrier protein [Candidatus Paceibacterota bacterium]
MNREEIFEKVVSIVADRMNVHPDEVNDDTNFTLDLCADSLDMVELVMEFEEKFEITIPEGETERIKSVGEAVNFIFDSIISSSAQA